MKHTGTQLNKRQEPESTVETVARNNADFTRKVSI